MTDQDDPDTERLRHIHPIARGFWLVLGFFFVGLGIIGALLPVMPTVIFLIFAVGCFARSSPRLEKWLLHHPRFGAPLRAWRYEGAISKYGKMAACGGMALGYAMFFIVARPQLLSASLVGAALAACAVYVISRPLPRQSCVGAITVRDILTYATSGVMLLIASGASDESTVPFDLSTARNTIFPGAWNCGGSSLSGRASM